MTRLFIALTPASHDYGAHVRTLVYARAITHLESFEPKSVDPYTVVHVHDDTVIVRESADSILKAMGLAGDDVKVATITPAAPPELKPHAYTFDEIASLMYDGEIDQAHAEALFAAYFAAKKEQTA